MPARIRIRIPNTDPDPLTWLNPDPDGIQDPNHTVFFRQVSRETTYPDLQKLLMKEMAPILHDDILISAQKVPLFRIRVLDGFEGGAYLDEKVELPLYMECVETAINISQVYRVPYTVGCRQS